MPDRRIPSSLWFLAILVAASTASAFGSGFTLYFQTRAKTQAQAEATTAGHVADAPAAIAFYGCGGCHVIPGIQGANGKVGPDLTKFGERAFLAGSLPNDPAKMIQWLEHPQSLRPGSGMPEMGVTEKDARNIAAYLYAK